MPNIWTCTSERIGKYLYKTNPYSQAHAYILSEEYMKEIVTWKFSGDAYDCMHRNCNEAYSFHPQSFSQMESLSSLNEFRSQVRIPITLIDKFVHICSWYALHVGEKMALVFCVCAIFVLMLYGKKQKRLK